MKVGDIVASNNPGHPLRSGAEWYPNAVVVQLEPLILVSQQTDMLWSATTESLKPYLEVVGHAPEHMLTACMERLKRYLES